jgi:hypothetical protein
MKIQSMKAAQMPLREQFEIAGTRCSVRTNSAAVLGALRVWPNANGDRSQRCFELNVLVDGAGAPPGERSPHFRGLHQFVFATFGTGELFVFDLSRFSVAAVVSRQTAADTNFWRALVVPISLGLMGTAMGLVPLHSACLDWNGKALMIAGASGAGKSTLAVELARSGFSFVSDDWTYFATERGELKAYGLRAPVKLLTDAPAFFPELRQLKPAKSLNGEVAFEVDLPRIFGRRVRSKSNPAWIVLLERTDRHGYELERCSSAEIRKFFESSVERLPSEWANIEAVRSKVIEEVACRDCWTLRYGGPPQIAAEALIELCERNAGDQGDRAATQASS